MLRTVSLPSAVLAAVLGLPVWTALAEPAPDRAAPAVKAATQTDAARREAEDEHRKRAQAMTRAALEAQKRALDALAATEQTSGAKRDAAAVAAPPASPATAAKETPAEKTPAQDTAKSEADEKARKDAVSKEIAERHRREAEADKSADSGKSVDAATTAAPEATTARDAATPEADDTADVAAVDAAEQPAAQVATPAPVRVDPVVETVRTWLADASAKVTADKADLDAATAFYGARTEAPLWVDAKGFTARGKTALNELNKAAEWGLSPDAFALPRFNVSEPSTGALAEAEARLSLELLKYARHARGGRITPSSVSMLLDVTPPVKDPNAVLAELAKTDAPDRYLQGLHPQHEGFKLLRKALLKARGPAKADVEIDPALQIRLPERQAVLRMGSDDPEVAQLRKRLKVPADDGVAETVFDESLDIALKAFQVEQQVSVDGVLGNGTRRALNRAVDGQRGPDPGRMVQLIELNMERWRWLPEDLGKVHVWNNIPEYVVRVFKDDEVIFREKIIVGKPSTATPVFSADMDFVGFNPTWGMPAGIKQRELAPRLRRAAENGGGFLFFSSGPSPSDVIRAYGLNVFQNGRQINPDSVDWSRANVQNFSFVQPPGPKNPLGQVKFIYRNKHDVYMHDTIEPGLFSSSNRALSNGCIRVQNPMEFAAIMLREGNGLNDAGVQRAMRSGGEVRHTKRIPVHMVYFTAQADENGKVSTFSDVYGLDGRISSALLGRPLPRDPASVETASTEPVQQRSRGAQKGKASTSKAPQTLSDAITGFWLN
ncbi:MAG TPA: L,D-transpeptidase family protein [Hyphomicrobium sp.]|nr:L,D-transpeptidase family protein [Hyphomicrobium sp.]